MEDREVYYPVPPPPGQDFSHDVVVSVIRGSHIGQHSSKSIQEKPWLFLHSELC